MKRLLTLVILFRLLSAGQSLEVKTANFHVTGVRSQDATEHCTTSECSAKRITVEGYTLKGKAAAVAYVLECVEVIENKPKTHLAVVCVHVHAQEDYVVKIGDDYVSFSDAPPSNTEPINPPYSIVSEKEVR